MQNFIDKNFIDYVNKSYREIVSRLVCLETKIETEDDRIVLVCGSEKIPYVVKDCRVFSTIVNKDGDLLPFGLGAPLDDHRTALQKIFRNALLLSKLRKHGNNDALVMYQELESIVRFVSGPVPV